MNSSLKGGSRLHKKVSIYAMANECVKAVRKAAETCPIISTKKDAVLQIDFRDYDVGRISRSGQYLNLGYCFLPYDSIRLVYRIGSRDWDICLKSHGDSDSGIASHIDREKTLHAKAAISADHDRLSIIVDVFGDCPTTIIESEKILDVAATVIINFLNWDDTVKLDYL